MGLPDREFNQVFIQPQILCGSDATPMQPVIYPLNLLSVQCWEDWRKAFLCNCKTQLSSLVDLDLRSWLLRQFATGDTGKSVSPGKRLWTKGRDPIEGFNSVLRVDCLQGCWLWPHSYHIYTSLTASRESVVVWGCLIEISINRKLQVICGSFAYCTTTILLETFFV